LAASLGLLGERGPAKEIAAQLLQRMPGYTADVARHQFFFCNDPAFVDRYVEGLRIAGLPERYAGAAA
jgi:hypothetical protein